MVTERRQDESSAKVREIHGKSNVWNTAQDRIKGLLILGLNESVDQLTMANNQHWYGHVLRKEDSHVLRTLDIEVEDPKKWRLKRTWKRQVEEKCIVGLSKKNVLC